MSVRRLSKTFISGAGAAAEKSSSFLAGYSPAIDEMDLIERVVVGAGGTSAIEFDLIPQIYQHLQIRMVGRTERSAVNDAAKLQFNTDTGTNYVFHTLIGNGASATADAQTSATGISLYRLTGDTATANLFGVFVCDILDYTSTTKNKTIRNLGGADYNGANGEVHLSSGVWLSTAAVTAIKLTGGATGADLAQYSTASLYGVKA